MIYRCTAMQRLVIYLRRKLDGTSSFQVPCGLGIALDVCDLKRQRNVTCRKVLVLPKLSNEQDDVSMKQRCVDIKSNGTAKSPKKQSNQNGY